MFYKDFYRFAKENQITDAATLAEMTGWQGSLSDLQMIIDGKYILKRANDDLIAFAKSQGVTDITPEVIQAIIDKVKGDSK